MIISAQPQDIVTLVAFIEAQIFGSYLDLEPAILLPQAVN